MLADGISLWAHVTSAHVRRQRRYTILVNRIAQDGSQHAPCDSTCTKVVSQYNADKQRFASQDQQETQYTGRAKELSL